jgi:hypothetical protein
MSITSRDIGVLSDAADLDDWNKDGGKNASPLRAIVADIFERREYAKCWFADGDCANWIGCNPDCSLVKLREMAGIEPQEDGEIRIVAPAARMETGRDVGGGD